MKLKSPQRLAVAIAACALLVAACGDDDTGEETPPPDTPTATPAPTDEPATATPTGESDPSPTPTTDDAAPTRQPAGDIATGPAHTVYEASGGETLGDVAGWLDGDTGDGGAFDAAALAQINGLDEDAVLESGDEIAVPAAPPDATSSFAWNTLQQRMDDAAEDRPLVVLHPSAELTEGYLGRIALRYISIDETDDGTPRGYVLRFFFTDRPAFRAGEPEPDANYTDPAFTLTAGSRANDILEMPGEEVGLFTRDGVAYGILTFGESELAPGEIWDRLEVREGGE